MDGLVSLDNSYPIYLGVKMHITYSKNNLDPDQFLSKLTHGNAYCISDGDRIVEFTLDQSPETFRITELKEKSTRVLSIKGGCDVVEKVAPILNDHGILGAHSPTVDALLSSSGFQQTQAWKSEVCFARHLPAISTYVKGDSGEDVNALRKPKLIVCVYYNSELLVESVRLNYYEDYESP